jgi:hypothetical protein
VASDGVHVAAVSPGCGGGTKTKRVLKTPDFRLGKQRRQIRSKALDEAGLESTAGIKLGLMKLKADKILQDMGHGI